MKDLKREKIFVNGFEVVGRALTNKRELVKVLTEAIERGVVEPRPKVRSCEEFIGRQWSVAASTTHPSLLTLQTPNTSFRDSHRSSQRACDPQNGYDSIVYESENSLTSGVPSANESDGGNTANGVRTGRRRKKEERPIARPRKFDTSKLQVRKALRS